MFETCLHYGSDRSSGSRVNRPTSITLFIAMAPSIITARRGRARPLEGEPYRASLTSPLPGAYRAAETGDEVRDQRVRRDPGRRLG